MTVPKINGFLQKPITELQPGELVKKTYVDAQGQETEFDAVNPATPQTITWDTHVVDGVRYPVGGALSASAENTVYLYCHDHRDGSAICSIIFDVLVPGDTVTIETPTEVLTYAVETSFNLPKGVVANDERLKAVVAGRLVVVTCFSEGNRNASGETTENSAIILQLASAVQK